MMIFLTATMLTLLLAHDLSGNSAPPHFNNKPCQKNKNNNAAIMFDWKHILSKPFKRSSESAWKNYLEKKNLCNRPRQTFFEQTDEGLVRQICNGAGMPLDKSFYGNLCISNTNIRQYEVKVSTNGKCEVQRLKRLKKRVVVACDKVNNQCLPVHLEKYRNQSPNSKAKPCSPRPLLLA
ncbi:hypothetical protein EXN66_Car013418 [Xyrichtys novacula]|nr:hypothetical protein EXN66_Car013418 [Xyrichtys novacula]